MDFRSPRTSASGERSNATVLRATSFNTSSKLAMQNSARTVAVEAASHVKRGLTPPLLHPHHDPRLTATRSLRLPARKVQTRNGPSNIDPATGRPYNKRALPEPQCRCAAEVARLNRQRQIPCGTCTTCGQRAPTVAIKSSIASRIRNPAVAQQVVGLRNSYVPSYQKVVTFNLKPSCRTVSAPLFRSRSLETQMVSRARSPTQLAIPGKPTRVGEQTARSALPIAIR